MLRYDSSGYAPPHYFGENITVTWPDIPNPKIAILFYLFLLGALLDAIMVLIMVGWLEEWLSDRVCV